MIPASYFYKDVFTEAWGDPRNMHAEPSDESDSRGPRKGRFVGLIGLLTTVMPLKIERERRVRHVRGPDALSAVRETLRSP